MGRLYHPLNGYHAKLIMEKEWDEIEEEKISFGDRVETDFGEGMVTELDGKAGEYLVCGDYEQLGWFKREELKLIK